MSPSGGGAAAGARSIIRRINMKKIIALVLFLLGSHILVSQTISVTATSVGAIASNGSTVVSFPTTCTGHATGTLANLVGVVSVCP